VSQKPKQLNVALEDADHAALEEIRVQHGVPPTELARKLVRAALDFYRANGWFSFPVEIRPKGIKTDLPVRPKGAKEKR